MSTDSTAGTDNRRGGLPDDDSLADAFSAAASAATTPRRRQRTASTPPETPPTTPTVPPRNPARTAPDAQPMVTSAAEQPAVDPPAVVAAIGVTAERAAAPAHVREAGEWTGATVPVPADVAVPVALVSAQTPAPLPDRQVPAAVQLPDLGPTGSRATQCTVMVSTGVRDRFAYYQLAKKTETGREPTNAIVVRRAVLAARKQDAFSRLLEAVRHGQQPTDEEDFDPDGMFGEVEGRRAERGRMKDSVQQSFRPSYQELAVIDAISDAYGFPSRSDFLDAVLDAFLPALPDKQTRGRR